MRAISVSVTDASTGETLFSARVDDASPASGTVTLEWDENGLMFVVAPGDDE